MIPETEKNHLGGQPKFATFPGYAGLGEWLRQLRQAAGFSQRVLAQKIGVSFVYVSHIETYRRERRVPLSVVDRWASACGYVWEMRFNPISKEPK